MFVLLANILAVATVVAGVPALEAGARTATLSGWPESLEGFRLCKSNQPLLNVRNDASGLTADPSGGWWLVSNHPLAALQYNEDFSQLLQVVGLPGVVDPEAIAWVAPGQLAVSEEMGNVVKVPVPPSPPAGTPLPLVTFARSTVLINNEANGIERMPNKGYEGIAYNPAGPTFYVAQEDFPQAVYRVGLDGTYTMLFNGTGLGLKDFSEVSCWGRTCDSLLILSQGSKRIVRVDLRGNLISSLKVKGLSRPEGLAISPDGRFMAVASEPSSFSLYSVDC